MSGEHTPGPWRTCKDGECKCGFIWGADGETHVASAHGPSDLGQSWYGSDTVCNEEAQKANASLIAAAPDLLSIAKRWRALDAGAWHPDRFEMEKSELLKDTAGAIAKVLGEKNA